MRRTRKHGVSEARLFLLDASHESELYTKQERAALAWAEALTDKETHAPDEVYQAVRGHFPEKAVTDLSIAIAIAM
jgi:alkylhydroperoxidase family enzyme